MLLSRGPTDLTLDNMISVESNFYSSYFKRVCFGSGFYEQTHYAIRHFLLSLRGSMGAVVDLERLF